MRIEKRLSLAFFLVLLTGTARAEKLKLGYAVDPALQLATKEMRGQDPGAAGFFWRGVKEGWEVTVRATTLDSVQSARELSRVEFTNVAQLYDKRGNPYEGQISQLVSCDKRFRPKPATLKVHGAERPLLLAGANSRKSFGACNSDQITNWAAYFNYVDEAHKTVFSVRLFKEIGKPTEKAIAQAERELRAAASQVLLKETP